MTNRLEMLHQLLLEDPKDSFLHFAIAKEYEKKDDWEQAIAKYKELVSLDENYVGTYYHLGKAYEQAQETTLALQTYAEGITVAKKASDFHALSELNSAKTNLEMEL